MYSGAVGYAVDDVFSKTETINSGSALSTPRQHEGGEYRLLVFPPTTSGRVKTTF